VPTSGDQSPDIQTSLYGVRGGSILFHLNTTQGKKIQRIEWSFLSKKNHQPLFTLEPETGRLTWKSLWNRYEQRVHATLTSLHIKNLTLEDNGNYRARIDYEDTISDQNFFLSIYDPTKQKESWYIGIFLLVILLGILGIGMWICRRKEKKKEVMDSPGNQRNSDMDIQYEVFSLGRPEDQNQCQEASEQHPQEEKHLTTIYSEIQNPRKCSGIQRETR
ncbi:uncharacterized protein LOC123256314, partial [Gracilinanus agilis]|uniref:uncharacterized protein LOC123256314 n=1 Tax=Gracilinanus agilis TaxID=191870 RepID=UPI001CFD6FF3